MDTSAAPEDLLGAYDALLLDVYGVLVDKRGALPGAVPFVQRLRDLAKPFLVLTNSASRLPETMAEELHAAGLPIEAERILTSGSLLADYFHEQGLGGADCLVLGPSQSREYVIRAGGRLVSPGPGVDAEVVVIADQKGFPCLEYMDLTLSLILRRLDAGRGLDILLCNPDLIYPVRPGHYGLTAGGLASMLAAVLNERYPGLENPIVPLGKPHMPLFEAARRRLGHGRLVMLGDQLATDVLGAHRCGIDSVLVGTGLALSRGGGGAVRPTWYLPSLSDALGALDERRA
jgi:HAD superfamily hydrolase (TIGR01450 family)